MKVFKRIKKVMVATLIAAMTLGAVTGCSSSSNGSSNGGGDSKTLNFGCTNFSDSLDPSSIVNAAWCVSRYGIGECLYRFDQQMQPQPYLADSVKSNDDNTEWTFHIRDGVKFSNGKELTPSAVKKSIEYTFKQEEDGKGTAHPSQFLKYESIEADDESGNLTIKTSQAYADLSAVLANPLFVIVDVDADTDMADQPIGTGPYAVVKKNEGTSIEMEANKEYWNGDVPYEKLNIIFIKDATSKYMALENGDVDVIENVSNISDLENVKKSDKYNVSEVVGGRTGFAYINQDKDRALANDDLRKAVLMSVDDETLCNTTVGGMYEAGISVLPSSLDYGYDKLKDATPYDVEKAKKILDDAGIVDSDGDGYREFDGDGKNIELSFLTYDSRCLKEFSEGTAANIEKIGIKVNVQETDGDTEWNKLTAGEYDLLSNNWLTVQVGDPIGYMENWYSKSKANYCSYKNEKYDKLYEELLVETDQDKIKELVQEMQQILVDDGAALIHGYYKGNICSTKAVEGANVYTADYYWISTAIKPAE